MQSSRQQTASYKDLIIRQLERAPDRTVRKFSEFADECIKKYYPMKGAEPLAKALGKTKRQIIDRATYLGVRRVLN